MISFEIEETPRSKKGKFKLKVETLNEVHIINLKYFKKLDDLKRYLIHKINLLEIR
jgi:hypothetical protein